MGLIQVHAEFSAKPGAEGALRDILATAAAATKEHAGVLNYQFYTTLDGSRFIALEAYKDADALNAHMAALGEVFGALMGAVAEMKMNLFGEVPEAMKTALQPFGPTYHDHFVGFTVGE